MTVLQSPVIELIEAGFTLTPLRENRLPYKGWTDTKFNQYTPEQLSGVYGCVLQDDDLVLDYDPRRNVTNENQLSVLFAQLGIQTPIETYVVATGGVYDQGQGYHVYFKKPVDFPVRGSTIPGFPSIEIKTKGRYVVAEGSLHEHGKLYTRLRGNPKGILLSPESLLTICKPASDIRLLDAQIIDDSEHARSRFVDWIVNKGGHQNTAYVVANTGKDIGLPQETIVKIMLDYCNAFWVNDPISEADARARVAHAFQYGQNSQGAKSLQNIYSAEIKELKERQEQEQEQNGFLSHTGYDFDPKGGLLPTLRNCISFFILPTYHNRQEQEVENPLYGMLRFNMFSHQIEFVKRAPWHMPSEPHPYWTDDDTILLKAWWLQNTALYNMPLAVIEETIVSVAHTNHYHPIRQWLASLKWDGKPRLDRWLIRYAKAEDNAYTIEVGRLTLIGAVSRVMKPGCKHDTMLILEGKQDLGKSRLVKAVGGKWFADISIDPHNKDCVDAMQGAWILEASELEFMRRAEVNALKRFISLQTDKVRLPYRRRSQELPRQSIFIGTVNPTPEGYLTDQTGNRRYLPVACKSRIDVEGFKLERDQIFAEAYQRYLDGEKSYTTDQALKNLTMMQQKKREAYLEWTQTIAMWLEECADMMPDVITTEVIASQCLGIPRSRHNVRSMVTEVNKAIRDAGLVEIWKYSKKHKRSIRCWAKPSEIDYSGLEGL